MVGRRPDLSLVRRLKAKGRYDEAKRQLEGWLAADPDNPLLLYEMALVLDNRGQEEHAVDYYEKALSGELDPLHRIDALLGLGSSLRVLGRIHRSYDVLSQAVGQYPREPALKVFLALTLERMGNYGDAITELLGVIVEAGHGASLEQYRPAMRYAQFHRYDGSMPPSSQE